MHILITGGAGFLGSHLADFHLKRQDIVYVVDDLSSGREENIRDFKDNPNFYFIKADLTTWPDIEKFVGFADRIYHMAAIVGVFRLISEPGRVLSVNIGGAERLIHAISKAKNKPRLIMASTSEVYGNVVAQPIEEHINLTIDGKERSRTNYVISKIAAEAIGLTAFKEHQLKITILRIFNTIGPRQSGHYGMVVPRFINAAQQNQPLIVFGTGEQKRSFCDVRDFISIVSQIADSPLTIGKVLNVGHDQEISILDLACLIVKLTNSNSIIEHQSYAKAYGEGYDEIMQRRPNLVNLQKFVTLIYNWDLKKTILDICKIILA